MKRRIIQANGSSLATQFCLWTANEPVGTENLWISDQKNGRRWGRCLWWSPPWIALDDQGIVHDHVLHNTGFSAADD